MGNSMPNAQITDKKTRLTDVNPVFLSEGEVVSISSKSEKQLSFHHNSLLDILGMYGDKNEYNVDEVIKILTRETTEDFRNIILWNDGISSKISQSLFKVLQNFKNRDVSEYYHLILSLISYVPKNGGDKIDDFNQKKLFNDFQVEGDFSFIENILFSKYEELTFLLEWGKGILDSDDMHIKNSINDSLDLKEIDNILREIREITAISGLIMQIASKNIGITGDIVSFFKYLMHYHDSLSSGIGNMINSINKEGGLGLDKLHNARLLNLFELKLIELGNSHLIDYSKLNTANEIREKISKSLEIMDKSIINIDSSDYKNDKRFIFLKENNSIHKAKMFLQFCGEMDERNIHYKYQGEDSLKKEEQFILTEDEVEKKELSEKSLSESYIDILEQKGIYIKYSNSVDIIVDLTKRIELGENKLEKLMNIAFYLYTYGSLSNEVIAGNFSKVITQRQFNTESEYGMYLESIRISESIGRKNANSENMKMKLFSINEDLEEAKQKLEEANNKLEILATTDQLTGLKNRRELDNLLKIKYNHVRRLGASTWYVMFDLDGFKDVNDILGHIIGDNVLIKLAEILQEKFKRPEDVLARFGGDEFVLMLDGNKEEVERMIIELQGVLSDELNNITEIKESGSIEISFSAGIMKVDTKYSIDNIMIKSDDSLYKVKADGKNGYLFEGEKIQHF